jgi:NAD(P) transhydrogenase subunit alpha
MKAALMIVIFIVATVLGYRIITRVPPLLHTPLMSGMNALSGITVLGSLVAAAGALWAGSRALAVLAIVLATINVTAGFLVTGWMLRMFRKDR